MHLCILPPVNYTDRQAVAVAMADRARRLGLTQEAIAKAVGASQSQVSRVLAGRGQGHGRLHVAVCNYVQNYGAGISAKSVRDNPELVEALRVAWDGTPQQSLILATIIRGLGALGQGRASATRRPRQKRKAG